MQIKGVTRTTGSAQSCLVLCANFSSFATVAEGRSATIE